jgi:hypothetical protein
MLDQIHQMNDRLKNIEERFSEMGFNMAQVAQTQIKEKWKVSAQHNTLFGMHSAICIETIDPWKQNRVRYFSPHLHDPDSRIKQLPWAYPISAQGGFDDSGCNWVPPAGSKLCLTFEHGNRQWPFYLGTTWDRDRGPDGNHKWEYNIEEYNKIHEGHRKGYLVGKNDGSQVFPPWNTENYNGFDIDDISEFEDDPEAQKKITYPHIYGWKTPQKHMIKLVDGNYKCNFRWARIEVKSHQGNHFIMKDDHLHPAGQWAHPQCGCGGGDLSLCNDENGQPLIEPDCTHPPAHQEKCANPYYKQESECRPYRGPGTPQNNKVDENTLPQYGMQMLSVSGHTLWMNDKVELPRREPRWENGVQSFDFGCTDKYEGNTKWVSATGHSIEMNDFEERTKLRGEENYIRILTASGNRVELNDHSVDCECADGSDVAGNKRGIELESTSRHIIQMIDENNEQCGPCRREGGVPVNKATDAFVKIRTGYGLEIHMGDDNHQEETQQQYIQVLAPQYDACCGPHIIRLQEDPNCGQIFVRAGGDYICMTEGDHFTVVGVGESTPPDDFCAGGCLGPRNKIVLVSQHTLHYSCKVYFNVADIHCFLADRLILLKAGQDCKPPGAEECGPCVWPVIVLRGNCLAISDRVYASASCEAQCASIFQLQPFVSGPLTGPSCC